MNTTILIRGTTIHIQLEQYIVRIINNKELSGLLQPNVKAITNELVILIKNKYQQQFNSFFHVSDASLAVEIWGHIYVEKIATRIQSHVSFSFVKTITGKIIYHCETIDIGERGHDNNRFVWDGLAVFKPVIERFLSKKTDL